MTRVCVTGGSRGIGLSTVETLLQRTDWDVTFTWQSSQQKAQEHVERLEAQHGPRVRAFAVDFSDLSQATQRFQEHISQFGNFDKAVINAGVSKDGLLYFMDENAWNGVLDVSLNGFFVVTKAVLPHMAAARSGAIVTVASISGEAGNRGQVNYSAAKGALIAATKALAKEMGPKGIRANVVSPGLIETDMTAELPLKELARQIPLGRIGKPQEVAHAIWFLLSDLSSYVQGEVLRVNGGLLT